MDTSNLRMHCSVSEEIDPSYFLVINFNYCSKFKTQLLIFSAYTINS